MNENNNVIVFDYNGITSILVPSSEWTGTLEELATKDVPEGCTWRITARDKLPKNRTYRDAWTDKHPTYTVDIDVERAKEVQLDYMVSKAYERVPKVGVFKVQDFSKVTEEIEALDMDKIRTIDELYNTFPASIDRRSGNRKYNT